MAFLAFLAFHTLTFLHFIPRICFFFFTTFLFYMLVVSFMFTIFPVYDELKPPSSNRFPTVSFTVLYIQEMNVLLHCDISVCKTKNSFAFRHGNGQMLKNLASTNFFSLLFTLQSPLRSECIKGMPLVDNVRYKIFIVIYSVCKTKLLWFCKLLARVLMMCAINAKAFQSFQISVQMIYLCLCCNLKQLRINMQRRSYC